MQNDNPPTPPIEVPSEPAKAANKPCGGPPVVDMRKEFERITAGTPRDPAAERAFIEAKIDMIRNAPTLTDEEKAAAITELTRIR